ncbi:hypothetical protein BMS3Abin02_01842 [bacterium BMS3Abin02]|nr:hypothetical protein BMS3Abin02_01842 [bacterium BMS3Abin02]GBE23538.1 hypothetical protein BMS3Bbin01_02923 [bacterium BMS3Bbin01]HDH27191.1 hypothetical protein [Actinomycetota bacterium]HDK45509.1 hypothetical protein [Actinomycetota bacterium]HDL50141.1 hypothetical protein [Actinomycetota bacterium]
MAQQPNIELDRADLPRPAPAPAAATWTQRRPGEITTPEQAKWGGSFGRPGPDAGWALHLVQDAEFDRGDRPDVLERIVATTAAARAASVGRGPTSEDVEVALILLGLRPEPLPEDVVATLADARRAAIDHAAHERDKGRSFLQAVSMDELAAKPAELLDMLAA